MLSITALVEDNKKLELNWVAGKESGAHHFVKSEVAAADMVGHWNNVHPSRVQVFGVEEMAFYNHMSERTKQLVMQQLSDGKVPAIIVADQQTIPASLISFCALNKIPLLSTREDAAHLIDVLRIYLGERFAPKTDIHGVFLDVFGLGVLLTGESGLGKSELALELISRGHGLVADDVVEFSRVTPTRIDGRCPELLQNLLEVRGLGLLDIKTIFGETSVRRKMPLKLIVHLVRASTADKFERLPIQEQTQELLGLDVRRVIVHVAAGRNLAVLVEAAVRNTILQLRGIDTLGEFMARQSEAIKKSTLQDSHQQVDLFDDPSVNLD